MRFDELDLSDDILDALDAMRFDECTPIQEQAIPVILEGRDLIAVAQTGTRQDRRLSSSRNRPPC